MKLSFENRKTIFISIALLLLFRIIIHALVYYSGYISLTADEFGRTFLAAKWSKEPYTYWYGPWLPFHLYLLGSILFVNSNLLWTPRIVTIIIGLLSIIIMYFLASDLFKNPKIGLVSAFLLSVNPSHIWLSAVPLTEIPNALLILTAVWAFGWYLENSRRPYLYITVGTLFLANGLRYESWLISVIFMLILSGKNLLLIIKKKIQVKDLTDLAIVTLIIGSFPIAWIIGNYIETGNPFYFISLIKSYKSEWYGASGYYMNYVNTLFFIDPYVTILGLIGIVVLLKNKKTKAIIWYLTISIIPFIVYILSSGGQIEPPGNYIRYLALFLFLFYPALGYLIISITEKYQNRLIIYSSLLFLMIIAITQIESSFQFTNDPASGGVDVGLAIRELREKNPDISDQPVLIELSYWQHITIHVASNDIDNIVYDREVDMFSRTAPSLIITDDNSFKSCLVSYQISYIIVKDVVLKSEIENKLHLLSDREVNGYSFYPLDKNRLNEISDTVDGNCPLPFGSGY